MQAIEVFCPATIANVSCGFDVLGVALQGVGDKMVIRKSTKKGIQITKIVGEDVPLEPHKNVAGVAALAMLAKVNIDFGFEIEIYKNIKPGSGIGSSAASSSGAVFGMNEFLDEPFSKKALVEFAMEGEKLASGTAHADNVAPAIMGGFTLIRSYEPLDIIQIKSPTQLYVSVIHPQIEIKTSDARGILKTKVAIKTAIKQWGNLAGLISGLHTENYDLIGRSMQDFIVEPIRSILIPAYEEVKKSVLRAGALGCGISGSGPSIFAFSKGAAPLNKIKKTMATIYEKIGIAYQIHGSKINDTGIQILNKK